MKKARNLKSVMSRNHQSDIKEMKDSTFEVLDQNAMEKILGGRSVTTVRDVKPDGTVIITTTTVEDNGDTNTTVTILRPAP